MKMETSMPKFSHRFDMAQARTWGSLAWGCRNRWKCGHKLSSLPDSLHTYTSKMSIPFDLLSWCSCYSKYNVAFLVVILSVSCRCGAGICFPNSCSFPSFCGEKLSVDGYSHWEGEHGVLSRLSRVDLCHDHGRRSFAIGAYSATTEAKGKLKRTIDRDDSGWSVL